MILYLALIVLTVLACAACAGGIYAYPDGRREGRIRALGLLGFAYWGACQLLYHLAPDPQAATWIARASAPGWIFLGPLCLAVFRRPDGPDGPWVDGLLRGLVALSALGLALAVATPWVVAGMRPASWGHGIAPGPLFAAVNASNLIGTVVGLAIARRASGRFSPVERRRRLWIALAIGVPAASITVTDVALPVLGVVFPPLAPALFGPLALLLLWMRARIGYSPLTAAHVAGEILEALPDGVALLHADGRIRLANQGLARMCGVAVARLEGIPVGRLLTWRPGEPERGELRGVSGQPMPVAISAADLLGPGGAAIGRVLVVRDLREVADLRNRLIVSGRLAAVGELAAGIAHEINNPLAFVRSNLSQLEEHWKQLRPRALAGADAPLEEIARDCDELIEESIEGVDRAVEIVRGVKSFAHAGSDARESTDLHALLDDTLHVASSQLRGRVHVRREYDEDLPSVACAPQQLKQVFLNLVINAAQAVDDGGNVLVATRPDGGHVVVSVADDGCGIAPEIIDRIFDPFFTTKGVGVGTGLGLGIAHQIVTSHDGEIQVESDLGKGTVFRVRLPAEPSETA